VGPALSAWSFPVAAAAVSVAVEGAAQLAPAPRRVDLALHLALRLALVVLLGVGLLRAAALQRARPAALVLVAFTGLGLGLRLWAAWETNHLLPDSPARFAGDESQYHGLATDLLRGQFFQWPGRTPVYPLFLALCYLVLGPSIANVLYAQAVVAATAVPLSYVLARRFLERPSALFVAALVALHPALIERVTIFYTESIYTPLLLITILSLLWALEAPRLGRFALSGALMAVLTLCRPATGTLPLVLPVLMPRTWSLSRRAAAFAVSAVSMAIVVAPWAYHNYQTFKVFMPLTTSGATFWLGSPEFYHLMEQKLSLQEIWKRELTPEQNGGHHPYTLAGDRYFTERTLASIRAEPGVYAWYAVQKGIYFWIGHPASDWPGYVIFGVDRLLTDHSAARAADIVLTRALPVVALLALLILRRRLPEFIPLLVICGYFTLIHALIYASIRFSEPLQPILLILIAAAIEELRRSNASETIPRAELDLATSA
jgi:4-amino-4-deoxy-L-arabinose transferase-like glycosyltransferase